MSVSCIKLSNSVRSLSREEKSCDQAACGKSDKKIHHKGKTKRADDNFIQFFLLLKFGVWRPISGAL
jgi:hypothetical protein